jgi:hypothetical protein
VHFAVRHGMTAPDLELGFESLSNDEVAAASTRSPTFDVAAVASVAGLRNSQGEIPLDDFVPRRTPAGCPRELDRTAKLLLAHVDGTRTLEQIARSALLPLADAITIFFDLLALGVVECDGATTTPS